MKTDLSLLRKSGPTVKVKVTPVSIDALIFACEALLEEKYIRKPEGNEKAVYFEVLENLRSAQQELAEKHELTGTRLTLDSTGEGLLLHFPDFWECKVKDPNEEKKDMQWYVLETNYDE